MGPPYVTVRHIQEQIIVKICFTNLVHLLILINNCQAGQITFLMALYKQLSALKDSGEQRAVSVDYRSSNNHHPVSSDEYLLSAFRCFFHLRLTGFFHLSPFSLSTVFISHQFQAVCHVRHLDWLIRHISLSIFAIEKAQLSARQDWKRNILWK